MRRVYWNMIVMQNVQEWRRARGGGSTTPAFVKWTGNQDGQLPTSCLCGHAGFTDASLDTSNQRRLHPLRLRTFNQPSPTTPAPTMTFPQLPSQVLEHLRHHRDNRPCTVNSLFISLDPPLFHLSPTIPLTFTSGQPMHCYPTSDSTLAQAADIRRICAASLGAGFVIYYGSLCRRRTTRLGGWKYSQTCISGVSGRKWYTQVMWLVCAFSEEGCGLVVISRRHYFSICMNSCGF